MPQLAKPLVLQGHTCMEHKTMKGKWNYVSFGFLTSVCNSLMYTPLKQVRHSGQVILRHYFKTAEPQSEYFLQKL